MTDPTKDAERLAEIRAELNLIVRTFGEPQKLRTPSTYEAVFLVRLLDAAIQERDEARREERESCAKQLEDRACHIRDHGPVDREGLLTGIAGAHVGCLFDAAAAIRRSRADEPSSHANKLST